METEEVIAPSVETPSEPTEPVVPTEPTESEPELYELPDGRKVDAGTLSKEWKENFAPEFTRRSQELAELKKSPINNNPTEKNPLEDPDWTPSSYGELIKIAKEQALKEIEAKENFRTETQKALETEVDNQLSELKKIEPKLNENQLFLHATKYGFKDLKVAHQNMKDMHAMIKNVQIETAKNIQKRANEPVGHVPGSITPTDGTLDYRSAMDSMTPREVLRSLKK